MDVERLGALTCRCGAAKLARARLKDIGARLICRALVNNIQPFLTLLHFGHILLPAPTVEREQIETKGSKWRCEFLPASFSPSLLSQAHCCLSTNDSDSSSSPANFVENPHAIWSMTVLRDFSLSIRRVHQLRSLVLHNSRNLHIICRYHQAALSEEDKTFSDIKFQVLHSTPCKGRLYQRSICCWANAP